MIKEKVKIILFISLFSISFLPSAFAQEEQNLSMDSLLVEFAAYLSDMEDDLNEFIDLNEGRKTALTFNSRASKFLLQVNKHYRIGYNYLMEDYGIYSEDAGYVAYGLHEQNKRKPHYYRDLKKIVKLSRKMASSTRIHRMLRLKDKLLWRTHEFSYFTAVV